MCCGHTGVDLAKIYFFFLPSALQVGMYKVLKITGTRENSAELFIDVMVQACVTTFPAE